MGVSVCRGGEIQPRFSSSLPTYLPVSCQLQGADSSFFLQEAGQEVMRNGSLQIRTEPFFLHQLEVGAAPLPSVNCSYGNMTAEAPVPLELLQGHARLLGPASAHITLNWKVRAQVVSRWVGSARPLLQVLFYLVGRRWDEATPRPERLPCVRLMAVHESGEASLLTGCRLDEAGGGVGICVARLELPASWFSPSPGRRRLPDTALPGLKLYYSVQPVDERRSECPTGREQRRGQSEAAVRDMQSAGAVGLVVGPAGPRAERLRLDDNVEILVPPAPLRLGQTAGFRVRLSSASSVERFTLRLQPGLWFGPQHHEDGIINGAKLPTGCQMLRCMLAIKPGANGVLPQFEAAMVVLEQVWPFYMKANIPMLTEQKDQVLETISEEQHKQWTPPPLCSLHWDSKLTPMLSIRPCQLPWTLPRDTRSVRTVCAEFTALYFLTEAPSQPRQALRLNTPSRVVPVPPENAAHSYSRDWMQGMLGVYRRWAAGWPLERRCSSRDRPHDTSVSAAR
ncbi:hypothetical protein DPEC_G00119960 [Dallia pectoralis]|uniref:Uncharacterized protein n=1 Tax=Dallia pectoralis TaxID=75939 RepID=A0ACC2GQ99_DALPE|nr:hypothetical protein DPEC_G00119960 [Dallia pectoralis]